ncbi:type 2 isopentenyl-diphosphate Delta-isomerase [Ammoniphilus sp. CFH 90114]|uniref:type 2 isopentenyl-diphosphate Delta-isomerase n=1 Tax=Ammoniphilus sp. CFH 90114 TaxID=2493665 RepID=UPI00100E8131|nr:type 2 isopentenyl-diphosphate Delta-isomerase [Ammoniphilus sp. CFH 90114]RXT14042.1 type 2 isopentenyl-diphosphate Delta-isomerase [Ammoniphilus sp. CFH 90114]
MQRTSRKNDHIKYAIQTGQSGHHGFADVKFVHNCIPQTSVSDISMDTTFGGLQLSSPIVINAMTGGASETFEINRKLARLAKVSNLAMAVGSQMAAIKDPSVRDSYTIVREENPDGIILANLGAEATPDQALEAIEMIAADGLQIHLNIMQELIMPEGDRDFRGVLTRIEKIVRAVNCPVIVKEVGFGMSQESISTLSHTGISAIDIGGAGGTNFARIENARRSIPLDMLNDWGLTTVQSLLEASSSVIENRIDIMATGGIQNGLDVAKSLALGASTVGMAGRFLHFVTQYSEEEAILAVDHLHEQLRLVMAAVGVKETKQLASCPLVISGESYHWAQMRGIDCHVFSRRKKSGEP